MKAILVLVIVLAAVITAACYICYRKVFTFDKNKNTDPRIMLQGEQYAALKDTLVPMVEETLKLPFTDVYVTSFDGLRLHGAYYEAKAGAPVEIMCHGYKSIAVRDFSGGIKLALASVHNVLLSDQRAHGKSEGKCLTFGINERKDCLSWIEYIIGRNGADTKIILMGMSMGAATVLMASELELPKNVVGIVADSAYTSPKAIICK
ncbi:MAG: alpha/beta hydrolase, partial [Clostridia bacterium]|nr:alpha/beta hydrolase [Clostridia bacterium]